MILKVPCTYKRIVSIFSLVAAVGAAQFQGLLNLDVGLSSDRLALIEQATDGDLSEVTSSKSHDEVREHFGNPDYFIKYIIKIPPVYA